MAKIQLPDLAKFDKGIESISFVNAKNLKQLTLPDPTKLVSSEKEATEFAKLWKPVSIESSLKLSLLPPMKDRDELSPAVYQKRLKDAKGVFVKRLEEERERKKRQQKKKNPFEEDAEEVFEQVINDLEEAETNQDLLWMLKQVVHLA